MKVTCCPGRGHGAKGSESGGRKTSGAQTPVHPDTACGFVHQAEAPAPTGHVRKGTACGADESSLYRLHGFPRNLKPVQKIKLTLCFTCFFEM